MKTHSFQLCEYSHSTLWIIVRCNHLPRLMEKPDLCVLFDRSVHASLGWNLNEVWACYKLILLDDLLVNFDHAELDHSLSLAPWADSHTSEPLGQSFRLDEFFNISLVNELIEGFFLLSCSFTGRQLFHISVFLIGINKVLVEAVKLLQTLLFSCSGSERCESLWITLLPLCAELFGFFKLLKFSQSGVSLRVFRVGQVIRRSNLILYLLFV